MKNGLLIWNVVLTLLVGLLLIKQFSGSNGATGKKANSADTLNTNKPLRIAYFEMDSVAAGFEMVKTLKADLSKKENDMQNELDRRKKDAQAKFSYYKQLETEGKLSQEQAQTASAEMKKMDDDINLRRQQMEQEYNDFMAKRQTDIKTKIEEYIREYNKTKNYTYVLSDDPGLFYYRDTAYNITKEVIKGLNLAYKPAK